MGELTFVLLMILAMIIAAVMLESASRGPRVKIIDAVAMCRLQDARRAVQRDRPKWRVWVIMAIALVSLFWKFTG